MMVEYNGLDMLAQKGGYMADRRIQYPYDDGRKTKIAEMESLVRMYASLKAASATPDVVQPIEDTIKRLTAEIFYLETTK